MSTSKPHRISLVDGSASNAGEEAEPETFFPRHVGATESWLLEMPHQTVGFLRIRYQGQGTLACRLGESRNEALGLTFGHVEHSEEAPQIEEAQLPEGQTTWQSSRRAAVRWGKITFTAGTRPVCVESIEVEPCGHPVEHVGGFACSDWRANQMYETGVRTVRLCMQQTYEDGVRRDRLPWIFDSAVAALVNYYAFADRELFRTTWRHFAQAYSGDGIIRPFKLWDYACWWNIALHTHFLHTDDAELVSELYPKARQNMDALVALCDETGLLGKQGRVEVFGGGEALLFKALLDTAAMACVVGEAATAERYRRQAQRVKLAINAHLWDSGRGCYIDARPPHANIGHRCSERCVEASLNSFAMLYGVADEAQARAAASYLQRNLWGPYGSFLAERPRQSDGSFGPTPSRTGSPVHNDCIWPVINFFEVEALFASDTPKAWELLQRCWGNMIDQGADTYWECVHQDGTIPALWTSLCHGWSAGISYTLPATVVGVRPLRPGFRSFTVLAHPGPLEWARATVPTPYGPIEVEVFNANDHTTVEIIASPSECQYVAKSGHA